MNKWTLLLTIIGLVTTTIITIVTKLDFSYNWIVVLVIGLVNDVANVAIKFLEEKKKMISKNSNLKIKIVKREEKIDTNNEGFYNAEQVQVLSPLETYEIAIGRGLKVDGEPYYGRNYIGESKVETWERLTANTKSSVSMGDNIDKGGNTPTANDAVKSELPTKEIYWKWNIFQ